METKKVLFVAGESWPFIKTGGLGDVAYSLPKALKKEGVDIRVILPKYSKIPEKYKKEMKFIGHKSIQLAWRNLYLGVEELELDGIIYYFIDSQQYFFRDNVYGESDDCERFSFFSKVNTSLITSTQLSALSIASILTLYCPPLKKVCS